MNRDEAKTLLCAYRPGRDDAQDPAFAEALAWLERDPALAAWFAENQALDREMRTAFAAIPPPAGLKASILAASRTTPITASPAFRRRTAGFALAAGLIFLLGLGGLWLGSSPRGVSIARIQAQVPRLTAAHGHAFGTSDGNFEKIRRWLAANGGVDSFTVPRGLQGVPGVGCEVVSIAGTRVSILCFDLPGRKPAHLYVMDRSRLANPPPEGHPEMIQDGAFATANWSDASHSYILAMRGDESAVRGLL